MKKIIVCLCLLTLFTPAPALADLIWFSPGGENFEATVDKVYTNPDATGVSFSEGPWAFTKEFIFNQFDPRLGKLEGGFMEFTFDLSQHHMVEAKNCDWLYIRSHFDFGPWEIFSDIISPQLWAYDPDEFMPFTIFSIPIIDQCPDSLWFCSDGIQVGVLAGCPTYEHFWDYCIATLDQQIVDINHKSDLKGAAIERFTGLDSIKYKFFTGIRYHAHVTSDEQHCEKDLLIEIEASLDGYAWMRGQYVFSPAVDVFVSNRIADNVLRFRYDGENASREIFIPTGEGGLAEVAGLVFTPEGDLLVVSQPPPTPIPWENSPKILRYNGQTGDFLGVFVDLEQYGVAQNMVLGYDEDLYVLFLQDHLYRKERVLRFDGKTGEYKGEFVKPCGQYEQDCVLEGAYDLGFGPWGYLYVTAHTAGVVSRYDGQTGERKATNFVEEVTGVRDIVLSNNRATVYLLEGTQIKEYAIDQSTRKGVYIRTVATHTPSIGADTAITLGPEMLLGSITTHPSLFVADFVGVFHYSPQSSNYTEYQVCGREMGEVGSAASVVVRPHYRHIVNRDISPGDTEVSFSEVGVSVEFSDTSGDGQLNLAVAQIPPGSGITGFEFLNTYYEFKALGGLSYTGPVEICIDIPSDAAASNPQMKRWNGTNWENAISSSVNGNQICATFSSMSWFGIAVNQPPVAQCQDVTVPTDSGECNAADVSIDNGSSDPDGDPITPSQSPAAPYSLGTAEVTLTVTDDKGLSDQCTGNVTVIDQESPKVNVTVPDKDDALQDGVTFKAEASDPCGMAKLYFYVREPDGANGTPIGHEDLEATLNEISGKWEHIFNTTALLDGHYVILVWAIDMNGNETWSDPVPFSIRNWAVIKCLPACKAPKAGRTMPVKFSLKIAEAVDPEMSFVYNEELLIKIYNVSTGELEECSYGDHSKDYRIDSSVELYITNYKTDKRQATYRVEIWRPNNNDFKVGEFSFATVK